MSIFLATAAVVLFVMWLATSIAWRRSERRRQDETTEHSEVLHFARHWNDLVLLREEHPRYSIKVIDWGPEFTGLDGTLHRYRWLVEDADKETKDRDSGEEIVGVTVPFMIGNEPTRLGAWLAALGWIEKQEHPMLVVEEGVISDAVVQRD